MLGELLDAFLQQRDLHLGGAGVAGSPPVVVENPRFASFVRVTTDVGQQRQAPPERRGPIPPRPKPASRSSPRAGLRSTLRVAAALASCVAETVMTGIAGGRLRCPGRGGQLPGAGAGLLRGRARAGTAARDARARGAGGSVRRGARASAMSAPRRALSGVPAGLDELRAVPGRRLGAARGARAAARPGRARHAPAHAKCLAMLAPVMMREGGQITRREGGCWRPATGSTSRGSWPRWRSAAEGASTFYDIARRVAAEPHGRARRPRHPGRT